MREKKNCITVQAPTVRIRELAAEYDYELFFDFEK